MSELQATVEFSVELHKFYNVDLFQRGLYQVRTGLKVSPKLSAKIEVNIARGTRSDQAFPPCILNGCGVSKTFQILYRNEEILLDNVIMFRAHILVESHKIEETLERSELTLLVELWFTEQGGPDSLTCVSTRTLQLNFMPTRGLHYSLPVLFDYFHLAAVTVTIHSTLVALHQPCIKKSILHYMQSCTPRSAKPLFGSTHRLLPRHAQSVDSLFFGNVQLNNKCVGSGSKLTHARHVHQEVCRILLTTYETLQGHLQEYMKLLPAWQQLKMETSDGFKRLRNLSDFAKACHVSLADGTINIQADEKGIEGDDDFISIANSDIAQLCAENILLWQQFLETFTCKEPVHQHLSKIHHQLRVKRFSEAFFVVDNPRPSAAGCYDANYQNYLAVAESVRRSRYLATLPPLPVTCVELDGDLATLPIIFEDQYQDVAEFARRRSGTSKKTDDDPTVDIVMDAIAPHGVSTDDCSCGIVAILESRSHKMSSKSTPHSSLSAVAVDDVGNSDIGQIVRGSLTLGQLRSTANISTLPKYAKLGGEPGDTNSLPARHSRSLDQLRVSSAPLPRSASTAAPALISPSTDSADSLPLPLGTRRLRPSASSLSMPGTCESSERFLEGVLLGHASESMPNLPPSDSPPLYHLGNAIIEEELPENFAPVLSSPPQEASLSPQSSSLSDDVTSEQSGWVSNSSQRCSSSSSSPAFSPDPRPKYSTLRNRSEPLPPLDADNLLKRLERLAVGGSPSRRIERSCDELSLPPPQQFSDAPPPPEAFRDPPPRQHSVDNLLFHVYDGMREARRREISELRDRKGRRRRPPRRAKTTSDEGFDELETRHDSDTSTVESVRGVRDLFRTRHPFQGYLFKEDVETLTRTFEADAEKRLETSPRNTNSTISKEFSKTFSPEDESATRLKGGKEDVDCDCYEERNKVKRLEDVTLTFIKAKEEFKRQMNFTGMVYSDFPTLASTLPYFHISDEYRIFSPEGLHLIVCVHGLDGNSADLRLVKTYLELGLPGANLEFLMSERNQGDTFSDFDTMTDKLVAEVLYHIEACGTTPTKISFIGHSLGTVIIRSAISRPQLKHLLPRFHTFLSLSGPHLGTLYNSSGLVNMGMWFMQKWKKSGSLLQLSLRDAPDMRRSFLYRLSQKSNLQRFKHVLLCGSSQDRYVPMHSARIELCKAAIKDTTTQGAVYREMIHNVMYPVINSTETTLVRYDIHHALPNTANSLIGRAAHIAVLDSELFIEKFLVVTGLKYFR